MHRALHALTATLRFAALRALAGKSLPAGLGTFLRPRFCRHNVRRLAFDRSQRAGYSGSSTPEPPNSLGKSFCFGSPSLTRSTASP